MNNFVAEDFGRLAGPSFCETVSKTLRVFVTFVHPPSSAFFFFPSFLLTLLPRGSTAEFADPPS